jgi:8-oxo-dGTP pyrophosphatase MutT (NUDIX family)
MPLHELRQSLHVLLEAHLPWNDEEASHLHGMKRLLESLPDPFARHRFDPGHFTVSAFVESPRGGALLMIRHPTLGRWLQPGGHVERVDASPADAARREVEEETGLVDLTSPDRGARLFDVDVHLIPATRREPAHRHFDLRFRFRCASPRLARGTDRHETRWVSPREMACFRPDPSMERVLSKWLRPVEGPNKESP